MSQAYLYAKERSHELVSEYLEQHPALFVTRKPSKSDLVEIARLAIFETESGGDR